MAARLDGVDGVPLIDPGSEWRLHREWYHRSAMGHLLKEGAELAA